MAFSAYKSQIDVEELGLEVFREDFIPINEVQNIEPTEWLKMSLAFGQPYTESSEKAASEFFIAPVILETVIRNQKEISVVSGARLEVKKGENGKKLKGEVDFLLCKGPKLINVKSPVVVLVESKKDDISLGYWQCAAEMFAAQTFNWEKNNPTKIIWGCVSVGFEWKFMKLSGSQLYIENNTYPLKNLSELLGVWQWILDQCKKEF